ncbi:helix-turn-helix domain-containing protein [Flammeovirgaceae bacterium SG7u.111]|nr:helix-turn-helix domain-containing protein [Flammeovirgaceae bacterium SG7u.132]WPO38481.1 helix-turn-helix domain-containing protein [Flammeovirgaceae bacterium SG7u.111]
MYLAKNLKFLRGKIGKPSQEKMGAAFDVTRSAYSSYEDQRAEPRLDTLQKMAGYFNLTLDQLLNVDLALMEDSELKKKLDTEKYVKAENLRILTITTDEENNESIVLVPHKASAGYTRGYADPEYMSSLPKYSLPFLPKGKTYRAFEIEGDSMLPLKSKSIVIAEYVEDWNSIKDGQICVVVTNNEGYVLKKVINRIASDRILILKSTNINYTSYEVPIVDVKEIWKFSAYISQEFPEETASNYLELKEAVWRLEDGLNDLKRKNREKVWGN